MKVISTFIALIISGTALAQDSFKERQALATSAAQTEEGKLYLKKINDAHMSLIGHYGCHCPPAATYVGTVSPIGREEDVDVEPKNLGTLCQVKIMQSVEALPLPPKRFSERGFPFVVSMGCTP